MKNNIKRITKISALFITAIIATFIVFSNKNIKTAKADTQTVEATTYNICTGIQTLLEDANSTSTIMPLSLEQYRNLTRETIDNNYKMYSNSCYQAGGVIQVTKIGNTLQFFYNDMANKKIVNFAYYGTYQKAMGEDRLALKLEGCMSKMQLQANGEYQITEPTYNNQYDSDGMIIGSPGIIIEIQTQYVDMSMNNKDNTITIAKQHDATPLSIYFDFINYNCIEVRFSSFNIWIYFGNTVWYNDGALKSYIRGLPIKGVKIESAVVATTQANNIEAYQQGYAQAIKDKEAYGEQRYQTGYAEGIQSGGTYSFENLILSVIDAPLSTLYGLLNFDILGTNMFSFVIALVSIVIIIKIIQIMLGRL